MHAFIWELLFSRLLPLALILVLAPTALASTAWYVNGASGSDSNHCLSAQAACKTIRHAITMGAQGDSIMVAPATYTENLTISISLTVIGSGAATTIVDGGGVSAVLTISGTAKVNLSGLTIRHGRAPNGGGIYNNGALTISNSTVNGNYALFGFDAQGGGIGNGGTLAINNSTIRGNGVRGGPGTFGGSIYGTATLQNTIVANNFGGTCHGTMKSNGYNLSSDGSCNFNHAGDLNNHDPLLGPLQNNGAPTQTMALLPRSQRLMEATQVAAPTARVICSQQINVVCRVPTKRTRSAAT